MGQTKDDLHKKVMTIYNTDFGHVIFKSGKIVCTNCGDESNSPLKPQSLSNHLFTISGFVLIHINCKEGGVSPFKK